jgi:molecular chaperone DnaJ
LQPKDYYSILGIKPSATADEVKKAFRHLAHQYHPDKKNNNLYALAQFAEIKEAYEILINPVKKEYYLQQRWYAQSTGKKIKHQTVTPVNILKQILALDRYVSRIDMHRVDHRGLFDYIQDILPDSTIDILNSFNEQDINNDIILTTLKSSRMLPFGMIDSVGKRLQRLSHNESTAKKMEQFLRHQRQMHSWEQRKIWIVLILVLLICLGIFFLSQK